MEGERVTKAGTIEVVQNAATYLRREWNDRVKSRSLEQFNKKDAADITKGRYTMATSKEGRIVKRHRPGNSQIWRMGRQLGKQTKEYHMTHTLQEMGLHLSQVDWSQAPNATVKVDS